MDIKVKDINEGQPVPEHFAFGVYDPDNHMALGRNLNPEVTWSGVPEGTRSFVVMIKDPDVPGDASDVNQEGKAVSKKTPRVDFYHWLLVDVPPTVARIEEGQESNGVVPKGKAPCKDALGKRGINDYTDFLAGDPDLAGTYAGYDGPCPPWNDEIVHRYIFTVFALDVEHLELGDEFRGPDVEKAMAGHILDEASVMATYTLNPDLR
ncbi:YbhB/YbcL family Raf kinase inhibitor-like protein [Salicola sp. Rm-C-2C1-2]|uniref:YbhB/YbcL family Raf kinase inhibitor-like protein n=1 Tax=Salicola sp. Rm-C-2C1-2 TaxID=3141321 RepID=UPI0032E45A71